LWALGIASAFVFWPIIGKYSQASGAWVNTLVIVGSMIGGVYLAYPAMQDQPLPTITAFGWLLLAGVLNGIAVYFYSLKAVDPQVPTGAFIMTVIISMLVLTPLFNYVLNGDILSIKQRFGLGTAIITVFLLAG
jgi:drug/metabolite transporter (DMT)-like permease